MATAMVWGASGGIGSALVHELVEQGRSVIAVARSDIDTEHTSVTYITADVEDPYSVRSAVLQAGQLIDTVHLWILTLWVQSDPLLQQLRPT